MRESDWSSDVCSSDLWQGGLLIDKATAAPFALVDMDDAAVWREHVDLANKHLAQDWLKMINGEPIPDW
jgi:hypothetical protein